MSVENLPLTIIRSVQYYATMISLHPSGPTLSSDMIVWFCILKVAILSKLDTSEISFVPQQSLPLLWVALFAIYEMM